MDLIEVNQVGNEILERVRFDLVIASSGCEERCTWLESNYKILADKKIALGSAKKQFDFFKGVDNKELKEKGFSLLNIAQGENHELLVFLENFVSEKKDRELNILIDYSGMSKVWFYTVLNFFAHLENVEEKVHVFFSYTPVQYIKSKKTKAVKVAESMNGNSRMRNPEKPTILIIGLGLESEKAEYIKELIKPDKTILLYADPAPTDYVDLIFDNNKKVISEVDVRNMINYPLDDLNKTMDILTNLILELRLQSNIILAPLGPKTFSLISMIINIHYPDVDIWRICSNVETTAIKNNILLSPMIMKLTFTGFDDE